MSPRLARLVPCVAAVTAAAILSASAVSTASAVLFRLADHADDDHGDGSLRYPLRDDLEPRELDLLSFAAHQERDGTTFEATFARPIRRPDRRVIDAGGATLDSMARHGFYTFNIDVYIDTDRRAGSGRTALLPGRLAEAEPGSAWERVVCLTPRPYVAKSQLARIETSAAERALRASMPRVDDHEVDALKSTIAGQLNARVFFPTRVSVAGASVRFFVPASFLGGTTRDSWGYIVVVSGAELELKLNLGAIFGFGERPARLMILPIASGLRRESFAGGRQDDPLQPPLVDIIVPPGTRQEDVLKDYDIQTQRPVMLTAVVPAQR